MLSHPAREPVGIEVHADDPCGPPLPLRDGVAVSTTDVEKQAAGWTPALGYEGSVVDRLSCLCSPKSLGPPKSLALRWLRVQRHGR